MVSGMCPVGSEPSEPDHVRCTTFCLQFYCRTKGDKRCCCDCPDRQSCKTACRNSPERCGLAVGARAGKF